MIGPSPTTDPAPLVGALQRILAKVYDLWAEEAACTAADLHNALATVANLAAGAVWTAQTGQRDAPPAWELCLPPTHPACLAAGPDGSPPPDPPPAAQT